MAEQDPKTVAPRVSKKEEFLRAVETKTKNDVHIRLLKACRGSDATKELETELSKVISEILS